MDTEGVSSGANDLDRSQQAGGGAVVRAFLIADVRGYTSFTHAHGDEAAGDLAARFAGLAREAVTSTGGEVIELRGDEALCVFPSARQALRAAVELQFRFRRRVEDEPVFPLGIGIGLSAGEAVPVEGGYRGGPLNLAARLCSLAGPGQILASETVTSLAGALEGVNFVERRRTRVKGLEKPVRVIEVVSVIELPPLPDAPAPSARRGRQLLLAAGSLIVVGGIAAAAVELIGDSGGAPAGFASVLPDSLAAVDSTTNRINGRVRIPGGPSAVATGRRWVWVASDLSHTISSVAVATRAVTHVVPLNATPNALAADGDAVWVLDGNRRLLLKVDPTYGAVTQRVKLPRAPPLPVTSEAHQSQRGLRPGSAVGNGWIVPLAAHRARKQQGDVAGRAGAAQRRGRRRGRRLGNQRPGCVGVPDRRAGPQDQDPNRDRQPAGHYGAVSDCHRRRRGVCLGSERKHPDGKQDRPELRRSDGDDCPRHRAQLDRHCSRRRGGLGDERRQRHAGAHRLEDE